MGTSWWIIYDARTDTLDACCERSESRLTVPDQRDPRLQWQYTPFSAGRPSGVIIEGYGTWNSDVLRLRLRQHGLVIPKGMWPTRPLCRRAGSEPNREPGAFPLPGVLDVPVAGRPRRLSALPEGPRAMLIRRQAEPRPRRDYSLSQSAKHILSRIKRERPLARLVQAASIVGLTSVLIFGATEGVLATSTGAAVLNVRSMMARCTGSRVYGGFPDAQGWRESWRPLLSIQNRRSAADPPCLLAKASGLSNAPLLRFWPP